MCVFRGFVFVCRNRMFSVALQYVPSSTMYSKVLLHLIFPLFGGSTCVLFIRSEWVSWCVLEDVECNFSHIQT